MVASSPLRPTSVLIADDNAPIRELLVMTLRRHFSICEAVADGRRLVEAALALKPDVIVSDVNMPVLGGIGAMRALRACGQNIPFVMVSADENVATKCLALGAAAFVSKLDAGRELVQAVLAAVEGRAYVSASASAP